MTDAQTIPSTDEAWENGVLGDDVKHARVADANRTQAVEKALGLKAISIRLPEAVIDDFKTLADIEGVGYQPLMREALIRFADCEMKRVAREYAAKLRQEAEERASSRKAA